MNKEEFSSLLQKGQTVKFHRICLSDKSLEGEHIYVSSKKDEFEYRNPIEDGYDNFGNGRPLKSETVRFKKRTTGRQIVTEKQENHGIHGRYDSLIAQSSGETEEGIITELTCIIADREVSVSSKNGEPYQITIEQNHDNSTLSKFYWDEDISEWIREDEAAVRFNEFGKRVVADSEQIDQVNGIIEYLTDAGLIGTITKETFDEYEQMLVMVNKKYNEMLRERRYR